MLAVEAVFLPGAPAPEGGARKRRSADRECSARCAAKSGLMRSRDCCEVGTRDHTVAHTRAIKAGWDLHAGKRPFDHRLASRMTGKPHDWQHGMDQPAPGPSHLERHRPGGPARQRRLVIGGTRGRRLSWGSDMGRLATARKGMLHGQ